MGALPWILGGGALAYVATRLIPSTHSELDAATTVEPSQLRSPSQLAGSWVWPMPRWNGRPPTISDGFTSPRPGGIRHGGVDLMFDRVASDPFKVGSPNGTKAFVMPDHMLALAAGDGRVRYAAATPRGLTVQLEHDAGKVVTYYTHLDELLVRRTTNASSGERVRAGQPIGVVGADPQDGEHVKHLHFEIWLPPGTPKDRIDPASILRSWPLASLPNA